MSISVTPAPSKELTKEETETVLRALGMYQIHLYDEMKLKPETIDANEKESKRASQAIKKIHASIEAKK